MLYVENGTALARQGASDTTFELHYSIGDLAKQWRLSCETIRLLIKDEPGVVRVRLGRRKSMTRYSVPESVARRGSHQALQPDELRWRKADHSRSAYCLAYAQRVPQNRIRSNSANQL
jgi:hypothetical protein